MVVAYILVKARSPEADRILSELLAIDGVVDGHIVAGDVDFIVKIAVDSAAEIKPIVTDSIQAITGIESTQTYMAMA